MRISLPLVVAGTLAIAGLSDLYAQQADTTQARVAQPQATAVFAATDRIYHVPVAGTITIDLLADHPRADPDTLWIHHTAQSGELTAVGAGSVQYTHNGASAQDTFYYGYAYWNGEFPLLQKVVLNADGNDTNDGWWKPSAAERPQWQLQLQKDLRIIEGVSVYAVDPDEISEAAITAAKANGAKLKCYISAGSMEQWRADSTLFPPQVLGANYYGWAGERWLDTRQIELLAPVMRARMDKCKARGFDAIDADNVNGFINDTGFDISRQDSINYIKWLAQEAHSRGLAFSLKNSESLAADVVDHVDMMQTESCFIYNNCAAAAVMIAAGKPVFAVEYSHQLNTTQFLQLCRDTESYGFSTIYRTRGLEPGSTYHSCN